MLQVFNVRIVLKSTRGLFSKKIIPTKLNSCDLTAMGTFMKIEATLQMRGHLEEVNSDMKGWDGYTQTSRNFSKFALYVFVASQEGQVCLFIIEKTHHIIDIKG